MKSLLALLLLSLLSFLSSAQSLHGRITNQQKLPIAHVNIFVSELGKGATSNAEGFYQINLPEGEWQIMFRYMGYQSEVKTINIVSHTQLDIQLRPQVMMLPEVLVLASGEDPAYYIMRHAIARAPYYQQQVQTFDCQTYVKGSGHMTKIPLLFRRKMKKEGVELNRTYSSESISQIHFEQPDKITQTVQAVRTSVLDESFSNLTMPLINLSLYDNWEMQAEDYRASVLSPFHQSAFATYRFQLIGSFEDQGHMVNKIQITPKVEGKNKFSGTICIVDKTWNIHSADLKVSVPFVDMRIKQIYTALGENTWLPTTQEFQVHGEMMGFAGVADYLATSTDYQLTMNPHLAHQNFTLPADTLVASEEENLSNRTMRQKQREIKKEIAQNSPSPSLEVVDSYRLIETEAVNDSTYWNAIRPMPLTAVESESFAKRDLAAVNYEPKAKKDSVERKSKPHLDLKPFYFNAVDGYKPELSLKYAYRDTLGKSFNARATVAAGVASENVYGGISGKIIWNGLTRTGVKLQAGRNSVDMKGESSCSELNNSVYTLFFENNAWRLYDKHFVELNYFSELENGLYIDFSWGISKRKAMENHCEFSFFDWGGRELAGNDLQLEGVSSQSLLDNTATSFSMRINYTPQQYYRIRKGVKYAEGSRFPTFGLRYQKAEPRNSKPDSDYDFLGGSINHSVDVGVSDVLKYRVSGGVFVNRSMLYVHDFYYAASNKEYLQFGSSWEQFNAADYYQLFSRKQYAEAHVQLSSDKVLLKRLPLLRRTLLNEAVQLHYFNSESSGNYLEAGYGISNVMINLSVNYGVSNWNAGYWSVRLGVSL